MRTRSCVALLLVAALGCNKQKAPELAPAPPPPADARTLRTVQSFAAIGDKAERSRAIWGELARVVQHPRCLNCHPNGDVPAQGDQGQPHDPPVVRGADDNGVVGMRCSGCHQDHNLELARVPGAPKWHLAPRELAWVGKSSAYICNQMKDPKRNGGKSLAELVHHNGKDELVGWGWHPGHGREPAPGTQEQFGALTQAWIDTGAECPREEKAQ